MALVEVVAALIFDGDRFLICKRPPNKARANLWEFVGGKVEEGESEKQALKRECREELAIEIEVGELFARTVHEYSDITVRVSLYFAKLTGGKIELLEHSQIAWITPEQIDKYEFCPADKIFLDLIKKREYNIHK